MFLNVGASGLDAIASISRWAIEMPRSIASVQCELFIWLNGTVPWTVLKSWNNGFCAAAMIDVVSVSDNNSFFILIGG